RLPLERTKKALSPFRAPLELGDGSTITYELRQSFGISKGRRDVGPAQSPNEVLVEVEECKLLRVSVSAQATGPEGFPVQSSLSPANLLKQSADRVVV